MRVKVKIKKLAGETGLLLPDTLTDMDEKKAMKLEKMKIVSIDRPKKLKTKVKVK